MSRIAPAATRAIALYLIAQSAFIFGVLATIDEQSSFYTPRILAICVGVALHGGLLWAPSASGRGCWVATVLMIPGAALTLASAVEEIQLIAIGRMHEPFVAFAYLGGAAAYIAQYVSLGRRIAGQRSHVAI